MLIIENKYMPRKDLCTMSDTNLFSFLEENHKDLATMGEYIEDHLFSNPHAVLIKARLFAEHLAKIVMNTEGYEEVFDYKQVDRIHKLHREGIIQEEIYQKFDWIRKVGNKAAHVADFGTVEDVLIAHRNLYDLSVWHQETYGHYQFQAPKYRLPKAGSSSTIDPEELSRLISQTVEQTVSATLDQKLQNIQQEQPKEQEQPEEPQVEKSSEKEQESTSFDLIAYLQEKGLEIVDKRPQGALWVIGGWELNDILFPLKEQKIYFRFTKNGSRSTKKQAAWFLLGKNGE